ncbi:MAG: hypothetical protein CMJ83_21230 [Planctomycetes bacterium]|nr:hypothetical protein [Planctomycetota bacterium]
MRITRTGLLRTLVLTAATLPLLATVVARWRLNWDSAIFIGQAESLAAGEGLRYLGWELVKYPPGVPIILTPIIVVAGRDFLLMRGLFALLAMGSVLLTERLLRPRLGPWPALAVTVVFAVSYPLWEVALHISSEPPFLFFSLATLVAADGWIRKPTPGRGAWVLGLFVATCLMRVVGLVIGPAIAVALLVQGPREHLRERALAAGAVMAVVVGLFLLWSERDGFVKDPFPAELPEGARYGWQLLVKDPRDPGSERADPADYVDRVRTNLSYYSDRLVQNVSAKRARQAWVAALVGVLWASGLVVALRTRRGVLEWYTLAYVGIYLVWPFTYGRFLMPLMPIVLYHLALPAFAFVRRRPGLTIAGCVLVPLAFGAAHWRLVTDIIKREHGEPYEYSATSRTYRDALDWCRQNLPENAVIAADRGPSAWLVTGRRSLSFPRVDDHAAMRRFFEDYGITHVVENPLPKVKRFLTPYLEAHAADFRVVERVGSAVVWEVVR